MQTIWKYQLETRVPGRQEVMLPEGSLILTAGEDEGMVALWVLVKPDAPPEPRTADLCWTGYPMPENAGGYYGTVRIGLLIWHVFCRPLRPL
jgi:hypothetical protein